MYSSDAETAGKIDIPSVYVTMKDGQALLDAGEVNIEVSRPPAYSVVVSVFVVVVLTLESSSVSTHNRTSSCPYYCSLNLRATLPWSQA